MYDFSGKTVAITGGAGVLGSEIVSAVAGCGAKVALLEVNAEAGKALVERMGECGKQVTVFYCDVLNPESIVAAAQEAKKNMGTIDCLVNGAGGNKKEATTSENLPFFDLPAEAIRGVFDLNFIGTVLASQVFGKEMAKNGSGVILNISSMNAFRPLTKICGYSAAKAAVSNFTQWLAVHINHHHSKDIRVNAIAPGFFLTEQNRFLLTDEKTGNLTPRGKTIIEHTPMGRFGNPDDLTGTVLWLVSDAAKFVTGIVVPVDGGFSAFSGV